MATATYVLLGGSGRECTPAVTLGVPRLELASRRLSRVGSEPGKGAPMVSVDARIRPLTDSRAREQARSPEPRSQRCARHRSLVASCACAARPRAPRAAWQPRASD